METPVAVLAVGSAFTLLTFRSPLWAIPAAIAPFVRPECLVFLPALAYARLRGQPIKRSEWLLAALVAVPLIAFQLIFFGTLWPHTAQAKAIVYQINPQEFVRLLLYASFGEEVTKQIIPLVVMSLVVASLMVVAGASRITLPRATGWLYVVAPALMIIIAYAANKVVVFPWYPALFLVPLHLALLALATGSGLRVACLSLLALVPVVAEGALFSLGLVDAHRAPNFQSGTRASHLLEIGDALEHQYPGASLVAPEIGALGFSFKGDIIDGVGLVTPRALNFHPMNVPDQRSAGFLGAVPARLVVETKPTLIVGLETLMEELLRSDVMSEYRRYNLSPIASRDRSDSSKDKVWGSSAIVLLVRNTAPEPSSALLKQ
jgi:hypothetical protein